MKRFLLPALLALSACAASPSPPPKVAQAAPAACATVTIEVLGANLTSHGGKLMADYHDAEAQAFNQFLENHVVDKVPEGAFDEILVWAREGAAIIVWSEAGCAIAHAAGPYSLVEPYIGKAV